MTDRGGIVHVTNFHVREATDGGSQRERALAEFVASRGGTRLTVQDEGYWAGRSSRFARLPRLLKEIKQINPAMVVLDYPSYPFLWQHKVTPYFLCSLLFSHRLRTLADKRGFSVIIDVMDLPAFQYADLGFSLGMNPQTLQRFDQFVMSRAHNLWVCSGSMAKMISERYGLEQSATIVALNGYSPSIPEERHPPHGTLKLAYAGSLNSERGIEPVIEAFLSLEAPAEFHLCGAAGDWIPKSYSDSRVIYHGALPDSAACSILSNCHLGLIPYPEKGYYNVAFATKLAFYMGIGLPVLCSNVTETGEYVRNMGIGLCAHIADFPLALKHIARHPDYLQAWREQVMSVRGMFSWSSIYTMALEESLRRTRTPRT